MPLTPNSSASAYASSSDLLLFYDARDVGDLVADDDVQVAPSALASNAVLLAALGAASGRVEAACVAGGRYAPADLAALAGVSGQFLRSLVCDLAFGTLRRRRGLPVDDDQGRAKAAEDTLQKLHDGAQIFSFAEAEKAGLPTESFFSPADISRLNLLSVACRRALGSRVNQLPRY